MTPACPEANECVATLTFDDDDVMEMLTFTAESDDTAKVEVVSWKTVENLMAEVVLKGIASTWAADATPDVEATTAPGHIMVKVTVTATDLGGETVEATLNVSVDGAPTAKPFRAVRCLKRQVPT